MNVTPNLTIPDREIGWRFTPSGGPGGQHANRSNTRVELTWSPAQSAVLNPSQRQQLCDALGSTITISVDDHRSQTRNRTVAEDRLAQRCRAALTPSKKRRQTRPSAGAKKRRLRSKRQRSETKQLRRKPSTD